MLPHIKQYFECIKKLKFNEQLHITAISALDGQGLYTLKSKAVTMNELGQWLQDRSPGATDVDDCPVHAPEVQNHLLDEHAQQGPSIFLSSMFWNLET